MTLKPEHSLVVTVLAVVAIAALYHTEGDTIAKATAIGVMILAPVGLYLAWQRNQSFDKQAETAADNLAQTEKRTVTDNFIKSIELLGASDSGGLILEQRLGAIYSLEKIAQQNIEAYHITIMETLCAYVRQHAPADPRAIFPGTVMRRLERENPGITDEQIANHPDFTYANEHVGFLPPGTDNENRKRDPLTPDELRKGRGEAFQNPCLNEWLNACPPLREDIRAILDVLSRRNNDQLKLEAGNQNPRPKGRFEYNGFRLDLRTTCLRGMAPKGKHFEDALLAGAQLEGADLSYSFLTGSEEFRKMLQSTNLNARLNRHCCKTPLAMPR